MNRAAAAVAAVALLAGSLAGCETTQEKSARLARSAKRLTQQKGLRIERRNAVVVVGRRALVQDSNGAAAVVELRNRGHAGQAGVPVQLTVRAAGGRALYANTTPGLQPSLVGVSVLAPGQRLLWVNDQLALGGHAARLDVRVGAARARAPAALPRVDVAGLRLERDSDGPFAKGVVRNRSAVAQRALTVYCVARRGSRIVAAGRATVDALPPGGRAPVTIFFIGDPAGAALEAAAPATVLR